MPIEHQLKSLTAEELLRLARAVRAEQSRRKVYESTAISSESILVLCPGCGNQVEARPSRIPDTYKIVSHKITGERCKRRDWSKDVCDGPPYGEQIFHGDGTNCACFNSYGRWNTREVPARHSGPLDTWHMKQRREKE